jgi:hypothetical protein
MSAGLGMQTDRQTPLRHGDADAGSDRCDGAMKNNHTNKQESNPGKFPSHVFRWGCLQAELPVSNCGLPYWPPDGCLSPPSRCQVDPGPVDLDVLF